MDAKLATFISTLREPRYSTPEHNSEAPIVLRGRIDGKEVVFFASPTDPMDYGRELHRRAAAGELGPIGDYVEPEDSNFKERR